MTEHIREIIHYPGSLDEARDGMTDSGDIVALEHEPEPPLSVVEAHDGEEDNKEGDSVVTRQLARPALELVSESEEERFIESEVDKGKTYPEAQEMWDQRQR